MRRAANVTIDARRINDQEEKLRMIPSKDVSATKGNRLAGLLTSVVFCTGLFSAGLGLTVLVGWHTHSVTLIQVLPTFVPMQYNTAVGFILCGAALVMGIRDKRRFAAIAGAMAAVVGMLTLGEYVFSVNLGIDELLQEHYTTIETSHPGRMAPNTAVCFALVGMSSVFAAATRCRRYCSLVLVILSSFAFGLSIVALSGYLTRVEATYGWGQFTRMAVHTAIGLAALSAGSVCLIWRRELSREGILPQWLPVPACIGVLTATVCFWQALRGQFALAEGDAPLSLSQSNVPELLLIGGMLLGLAMALAIYLAQVSLRRAQNAEMLTCSLTDEITERKLAEEELKKLSRAVDQSRAHIMITDLAGTMEYVNPAFTSVTGYSYDEAIGENPRILQSGDTPASTYEDLWKTILSGNTWKGEFKNKKKSGEVFWELTSISPITNDEGDITHFVGVKDDITERKRMQEMMIQTEKMKTVGGLAAGIAHEINNPLAVIVQGAQNVLMLTDPEHQRNVQWAEERKIDFAGVKSYLADRGVTRLIQGIRDSGQQAAEIVQNMLQFSRTEQPGRSSVDIAQLLDQAVALAAHDYDVKKGGGFGDIEIHRQYDPTLSKVICAKTEIQQVILNLLMNAAHSLGRLEPDQSPSITLRTTREDQWARLEVEDNGPGMSEDVRRRIFEPFFTTKDVGEGTGLGLFVSYFIITNNHQGTIEVQSQPGHGAKFIIRLPLEPAPERRHVADG